MNNQLIHTIQKIRSIGNPQQMAMNVLRQASNQGNPMAKNMLDKINSGDMVGAEQMLTNIMNEHNMSIDDIRNLIK